MSLLNAYLNLLTFPDATFQTRSKPEDLRAEEAA